MVVQIVANFARTAVNLFLQSSQRHLNGNTTQRSGSSFYCYIIALRFFSLFYKNKKTKKIVQTKQTIKPETDQQFEDTMNLVKAYKFPILNISQFYSRPGTAAAKMKKCNTKDIKSRSQKLTALFDSYDKCSHILGTVQRVLITEVQEKNDVKQLIGHTQQYVKVVLPYDEKLLG